MVLDQLLNIMLTNILELASTNGKKEFSDFSLINMEYVQSIEMMKKIESLPPRLSALNTAKVDLINFFFSLLMFYCLSWLINIW